MIVAHLPFLVKVINQMDVNYYITLTTAVDQLESYDPSLASSKQRHAAGKGEAFGSPTSETSAPATRARTRRRSWSASKWEMLGMVVRCQGFTRKGFVWHGLFAGWA